MEMAALEPTTSTNGAPQAELPVPPGLENVYLITLNMVPAAMKALVDLGVFNIMGRAGLGALFSPSEIAAKIEGSSTTTAGQLGRLLRLLTAHNLFTESITDTETGVERKYALNRISNLLVDDAQGRSLSAGVLCNQHPVFLRTLEYLGKGILEGVEPFVLAHGIDTWSYVAKNPEVGTLFNNMMSGSSAIVMKIVLMSYEGFTDTKKLVDVGGGTGTSSRLILEKYPHIEVINFDLPHVVASAASIEGLEHIGGDMFKEIPAGDTILMKKILHDWSDEHSLLILKNCYKALPVGGKIVLVDATLSKETDRNISARVPLQVDSFMMTYNVGGMERTVDEFRKLVTDAGFSRFHLVFQKDALLSVMEAYKIDLSQG